METDATATPTMWDELHQLAKQGADYEKAVAADRARLTVKINDAIEHTRILERQLEEIHDYLEAMT